MPLLDGTRSGIRRWVVGAAVLAALIIALLLVTRGDDPESSEPSPATASTPTTESEGTTTEPTDQSQGTALAQTEPPTAPSDLVWEAASTTQIDLTWAESYDDVAVAGYVIWSGGEWTGHVTDTSYSVAGLEPGSTHSLTVTAYDTEGNTSEHSPAVEASTLSVGTATEMVATIRETCEGEDLCFPSLSDWQEAFGGIDYGPCAHGDLVCANATAVARIEGTWSEPDRSGLVLRGWSADSDHRLVIEAVGEALHDGSWDDGAYRIVSKGDIPITVSQAFTRIEGIQVGLEVSTAGRAAFSLQADHVELSGNLLVATIEDSATETVGIHAHNAGFENLVFANNTIVGFRNQDGTGRAIFARVSSALVGGNSIRDCDTGIEQDTGIVLAVDNSIESCDQSYLGNIVTAGD